MNDLMNYFENLKTIYDEAVNAIERLRDEAEGIKEEMEELVDNCDNIINQF